MSGSFARLPLSYRLSIFRNLTAGPRTDRSNPLTGAGALMLLTGDASPRRWFPGVGQAKGLFGNTYRLYKRKAFYLPSMVAGDFHVERIAALEAEGVYPARESLDDQLIVAT